VHDIYPGM